MNDGVTTDLGIPVTFHIHLSCGYYGIINDDDVVGFDVCMNETVFVQF